MVIQNYLANEKSHYFQQILTDSKQQMELKHVCKFSHIPKTIFKMWSQVCYKGSMGPRSRVPVTESIVYTGSDVKLRCKANQILQLCKMHFSSQ